MGSNTVRILLLGVIATLGAALTVGIVASGEHGSLLSDALRLRQLEITDRGGDFIIVDQGNPVAQQAKEPTPTSPTKRTLAIKSAGTNKAGDYVVVYGDDSTFTIGKASLDTLPPVSLKALLETSAASKGLPFYVCVGSTKTVYLSKREQDCAAVDAANGESLP